MKTLAILCFMISMVCFGMGSKAPSPKPPTVPASEEQTTPSVSGLMLVIGSCSNCTAKEIEFIRKAEMKMNEVVVTECFQKSLSAMPLIQTEGRNPGQVVASLIHAGVNIDVEMYYTSKRVLGYTLPTAKKEWLNRRYMTGFSVCDLGSLLAHETSHKVGYDHDYQNTKRRPNSVPYSVNRAFKFCCLK